MTGAKKTQESKYARKISVVKMPKAIQHHKSLSVHAMVFLEARPMHPDIGIFIYIILVNIYNFI